MSFKYKPIFAVVNTLSVFFVASLMFFPPEETVLKTGKDKQCRTSNAIVELDLGPETGPQDF